MSTCLNCGKEVDSEPKASCHGAGDEEIVAYECSKCGKALGLTK